MKKIVFRVDSGNHIGSGHVMRCLTLAQELKNLGHDIFFITKNHKGFLTQQIGNLFSLFVLEGGLQTDLLDDQKARYTLWLGEDNWSSDLEKTNKILSQIGSVDLVVVDHYALDESYETGLHTKKVMAIDDLMNRKHSCEILLDQNVTADKTAYQRLMTKKDAVLLMGPEFALLRDEFRELHQSLSLGCFEREIKKIVIFFGTTDIKSDSLKIAKSLTKEILSQYEFTFILSSSHSSYSELQNVVSHHPQIKLLPFVHNMADLMMQTDLFIGAGGTTSWERASLGVASAILSVADNQTRICEKLKMLEITHYLGPSDEMSNEKWFNFFTEIVPNSSLWYLYRKNSFKLVDGLGSKKVSKAIEMVLND